MEVTGDAECHDRRCVQYLINCRESYHHASRSTSEKRKRKKDDTSGYGIVASMWSDGVHSGDGCED